MTQKASFEDLAFLFLFCLSEFLLADSKMGFSILLVFMTAATLVMSRSGFPLSNQNNSCTIRCTNHSFIHSCRHFLFVLVTYEVFVQSNDP